jgi:excisionase family DNA binding protein
LRTGKLPGVRIGKVWKIRESDLEAFMQQGYAQEPRTRKEV